ncbi:hypothetical protein FGLOB1_14329 [Fusarium globosum]|uniref:Uncharacterized protein n=1 Tax=Fusarium globosum TaxID=78864 RepID=A0A8H6CVL7_9HYPO|nr:hypothetical protein FGLOB1_14329 [Fusarium globosum]
MNDTWNLYSPSMARTPTTNSLFSSRAPWDHVTIAPPKVLPQDGYGLDLIDSYIANSGWPALTSVTPHLPWALGSLRFENIGFPCGQPTAIIPQRSFNVDSEYVPNMGEVPFISSVQPVCLQPNDGTHNSTSQASTLGFIGAQSCPGVEAAEGAILESWFNETPDSLFPINQFPDDFFRQRLLLGSPRTGVHSLDVKEYSVNGGI